MWEFVSDESELTAAHGQQLEVLNIAVQDLKPRHIGIVQAQHPLLIHSLRSADAVNFSTGFHLETKLPLVIFSTSLDHTNDRLDQPQHARARRVETAYIGAR